MSAPTPDLAPLPPIAKVAITWLPGMPELLPGQQASMKPVTITAYGGDGLPILLADMQQVQVIDAFLEQTQPHLTAAIEGFAAVVDLLGYAYELVHIRPETEEELGRPWKMMEVNGQPLADPAWSAAAAAYLGLKDD